MLSSVFVLLCMFIVISKWIYGSLHALLQSNLDMLHRFWVHVIWVPKLRISVCMCGRKILVLCKLWWMVATVQKFHYETLKPLDCMAFSSSPMDHWRLVYFDPARGFIAFCAPRLLAKWNAIKWIYCSVHVYCDYKIKTWGFHALF